MLQRTQPLRRACLPVFLALCLTACDAGARSELGLELVVQGLDAPLFVTAPPGDPERLFVVEQTGRIQLIKNGVLQPLPFLDVSDWIACCGERGLLGLAFAPDYVTSGNFYINYTGLTPAGTGAFADTRLVGLRRSTTNADVADKDSAVLLLTIPQPAPNHNGGWIGFGPDGHLYIATGDGGGGNDPNNNAQNLGTLLGKILRLDVDGLDDYAIPADNPFVADAGARPEIWAYGLRNPWRNSFDRATGDFYIGDVGQNAFEEVNVQPDDSTGGENYGWRVFEAERCNTTVETEAACAALADEATFPVHSYGRDVGRTVTGGYVYRGSAMPGMQGRYFFADYVNSRVWSFVYSGGQATDLIEHTASLDPGGGILDNIPSFGEDAAGELYIAVFGGGAVYRIVERPLHDADTNGNRRIEADELEQMIRFFFAGAYHCVTDERPGYAPGSGPIDGCVRHNGDYLDPPWQFTLPELLRVIELHNGGGYVACADVAAPDGFCLTGTPVEAHR